ncbi:MAG TPA: DUF3016 domain-containing protein [Rudaea sp.]
MKTIAAFALMALVATVALADPARVAITWAPTAQLSEVKDNPLQRGWMRPEEWQKQLADHIRAQADRMLPPSQRLEIAIDDIDLAGRFEPWRPAQAQDIRFMKDIYPPWAKLHFRLLDANGTTIREGSADLRDSSYLQRSMPTSTDPLRYDKRMFTDWLRKEFYRAK